MVPIGSGPPCLWSKVVMCSFRFEVNSILLMHPKVGYWVAVITWVINQQFIQRSIKYLRYNTHSDWSNVRNRSVYIRGQGFSARACTFHCFKIFHKSNIKRSLVSIYCDINTLEVVQHSRTQRNTWLRLARVPHKLLSCSMTPKVLISQHIDTRCRWIFLK
jgi:hypothetical protein